MIQSKVTIAVEVLRAEWVRFCPLREMSKTMTKQASPVCPFLLAVLVIGIE